MIKRILLLVHLCYIRDAAAYYLNYLMNSSLANVRPMFHSFALYKHSIPLLRTVPVIYLAI